jgi:phosphoserine phosphatase RsbU/P
MNRLALRYARRKLFEHGLIPRTWLGILTAYLAAITLVLYVARKAISWSSNSTNAGQALNGWITICQFLLIVLASLLALRYVRTRLMWRLRNRLLVTYVFMGVIPVVLIATMALLAGFLLAGQFATYLATNDLRAELTRLETLNDAVAADLASEIGISSVPSAQEINILKRRHVEESRFAKFEVTAWLDGKKVSLRDASLPPVVLPAWLRAERFSNTVITQDGDLFLLAYRRLGQGKAQSAVMSRRRIDTQLLNLIGQNAQEITFLVNRSGVVVLDGEPREFGVKGRQGNPEQDSDADPDPKGAPTSTISGGQLPEQTTRFDRNVSFISFYPAVDWRTGDSRRLLLQVHTRASLLYDRLFSNSSDLASGIRTVLVVVAVVFACIELFALFIGLGLTRTITRSVASLYGATQHINRGDLRHRITVRSRDQLAELEKSFNSMTQSLERLLAEQKEKQRIENELAIAHEVQAQLFPREETQLATLELHGVCRPARTVSGDYYDFLPLGYDRLAIAVGDISGKGISAALMMATVHSAVRALKLNTTTDTAALVHATAGALASVSESQSALMLSRGGNDSLPSPRELLWMLNRHLYNSTPAEKYATLFLGAYDGSSRTLTYSNAGHLPPMIVGKRGDARKLHEGGTVLGLFEDVAHDEGRVVLQTGDLFIAYSDGITEPENEFGEFGEARLLEIVRENRALPLARLSEAVITAVEDWIGAAEQPDDVTLVLARVREN